MNLHNTYISSLVVDKYIRRFELWEFPKVLLISKEWYEVYKKVLHQKLYRNIKSYYDGCYDDLHIGKIWNALSTDYKMPKKTFTSLINTEYVTGITKIDNTFITLFSIFANLYLDYDDEERKRYFKHRIIIFLIIVEYLLKLPKSKSAYCKYRDEYIRDLCKKHKITIINRIDKRNIEIINAKLNHVIDLY